MHKCLLDKESIEIKSVNLPAFEVTKEDWQEPVDSFRRIVGNSNYPIFKVLETYNLCPLPLITELSCETLKLFNAIGGIGSVRNPQEYYALQAFYVTGVEIIQRAIINAQPYMKIDS